jgi:hypothetical protein
MRELPPAEAGAAVPFSMELYEEILSRKPAAQKRFTFESHPELYRMARVLDLARRGAEPHLVLLIGLLGFALLRIVHRVFEKGDQRIQKLRAKWAPTGIVLWPQTLSKILR